MVPQLVACTRILWQKTKVFVNIRDEVDFSFMSLSQILNAGIVRLDGV